MFLRAQRRGESSLTLEAELINSLVQSLLPITMLLLSMYQGRRLLLIPDLLDLPW